MNGPLTHATGGGLNYVTPCTFNGHCLVGLRVFIQETRTFAKVKVKNNSAFKITFMPVQFDLMFALTSMLQKWLLLFSALPVFIFIVLFGRKIPVPILNIQSNEPKWSTK